MPYLYLVRHPKTHVDPTRAPSDWQISDEGRSQLNTLAIANFWRCVDSIHSSVQPKALWTAGVIAARYNIRLLRSANLSEVARGTEVFRTVTEHHALLEKFFANPSISIGGWESADTALERISQAIEQAKNANRGTSLAIISHGTILTLYCAWLEHEAPTLELWNKIGFAGVATVDLATNRLITSFISDNYETVPIP